MSTEVFRRGGAGLKALPKPEAIPDCFKLLGFNEIPDGLTLKERYRQIIKTAHPDTGGDQNYFMAVQAAYEEAEKALAERSNNNAE